MHHIYLTCVDILHQDLESLRVQPLQHHSAAVPLGESSKHGIEIRRTSSQYHLMSWDFKVLRHQSYIAQKPSHPHRVHAVHHLCRVADVLVWGPFRLGCLVVVENGCKFRTERPNRERTF